MRSLLVLLLSLTLGLTACGVNTPRVADKVGVIVRVSREGILSTTWEAQIIRGGLSNGSGVTGAAPFDFTIESDELAQKAKQFMEKGTEVRLTYRTEGIYASTRSGSGGDFATAIEPLK